MKFKGKVGVKSDMPFKVDARVEPLAFEAAVHGALDMEIGEIAARIGEIPIRMAIPFLRRKCRPPVVAEIGGFDVRMKPFRVRLDGGTLAFRGKLGDKQIRAQLDATMNCRSELDLEGKLSGEVGHFKMVLDDEDQHGD